MPRYPELGRYNHFRSKVHRLRPHLPAGPTHLEGRSEGSLAQILAFVMRGSEVRNPLRGTSFPDIYACRVATE